MEMLCIGFLLGVVVCLIIFASGVVYASRLDKSEYDNDSAL